MAQKQLLIFISVLAFSLSGLFSTPSMQALTHKDVTQKLIYSETVI